MSLKITSRPFPLAWTSAVFLNIANFIWRLIVRYYILPKHWEIVATAQVNAVFTKQWRAKIMYVPRKYDNHTVTPELLFKTVVPGLDPWAYQLCWPIINTNGFPITLKPSRNTVKACWFSKPWRLGFFCLSFWWYPRDKLAYCGRWSFNDYRPMFWWAICAHYCNINMLKPHYIHHWNDHKFRWRSNDVVVAHTGLHFVAYISNGKFKIG